MEVMILVLERGNESLNLGNGSEDRKKGMMDETRKATKLQKV